MSRKRIEREADLRVTAALYKRGWTMREIAREITDRRPYSVGHVTIKRDIDLILSRWKEKQVEYIDSFIAIQVKQIQALKRELWEEYLRSKKPGLKRKEKRKGTVIDIHHAKTSEELVDEELEVIFGDLTDKPKKKKDKPKQTIEIQFTDTDNIGAFEVEQTIEKSDRLGNPKYLELIAKLMDQEAKLLGFYNTDNIDEGTSVVIVKLPEEESPTKYISDEADE